MGALLVHCGAHATCQRGLESIADRTACAILPIIVGDIVCQRQKRVDERAFARCQQSLHDGIVAGSLGEMQIIRFHVRNITRHR